MYPLQYVMYEMVHKVPHRIISACLVVTAYFTQFLLYLSAGLVIFVPKDNSSRTIVVGVVILIVCQGIGTLAQGQVVALCPISCRDSNKEYCSAEPTGTTSTSEKFGVAQ